MLKFKDVFLGRNDLNILFEASDGKVITAHPTSTEFLINYGFISRYALSDNEYEFVITPLGIRYLEYLQQSQKNHEDGAPKGDSDKNRILQNICKALAVAASLATILATLKAFDIF